MLRWNVNRYSKVWDQTVYKQNYGPSWGINNQTSGPMRLQYSSQGECTEWSLQIRDAKTGSSRALAQLLGSALQGLARTLLWLFWHPFNFIERICNLVLFSFLSVKVRWRCCTYKLLQNSVYLKMNVGRLVSSRNVRAETLRLPIMDNH